MDTLIKINFKNYSDNELVENEDRAKQLINIINTCPDFVSYEVLTKGEFDIHTYVEQKNNPIPFREIITAIKKSYKELYLEPAKYLADDSPLSQANHGFDIWDNIDSLLRDYKDTRHISEFLKKSWNVERINPKTVIKENLISYQNDRTYSRLHHIEQDLEENELSLDSLYGDICDHLFNNLEFTDDQKVTGLSKKDFTNWGFRF